MRNSYCNINDCGKDLTDRCQGFKNPLYVPSRGEYLDSLDEIEMLKELQSIRKECPQYEEYYKENVMTPIQLQKVTEIETDWRKIPVCIAKPHAYMVFW